MFKISLIVPVYNTEKYLPECLNSLVQQSLKDIEIIIINDGSTDGSAAIIDEYSRRDARIKVISKVNGGQAVARNQAIEIAQGDYIGFVDSDDFVDKDMFLILYENAKQYDSELAIAEFSLLDDDSKKLSYPDWTKIPFPVAFNAKPFKPTEVHSTLFYLSTGPWNKIYKRDLIKRTNAYFPSSLYYEDVLFVHTCLVNARSISYVRESLYTYRFMRKSSTSADSGERHFDIFTVLDQVEQMLKGNDFYETYRKDFLICRFRTYLVHFHDIRFGLKRKFWSEVRNRFGNLSAEEKNNVIKGVHYMDFRIRYGFFVMLLLHKGYRVYNILYGIWLPLRKRLLGEPTGK